MLRRKKNYQNYYDVNKKRLFSKKGCIEWILTKSGKCKKTSTIVSENNQKYMI